ncbi:MAG TPA: twin-arginine translocase subunit TatC [Propionibacteriaceae bacterium]|nr:twin-arginine translocase subunit TatC [Propionibacteriaceae bacterium]HEX5905666.1 twin-arginine translocase subunit TatC [Propionibacteriaceae bacterium]
MSLTIKGRPIHFSLKWLKPPPAPPDGTMTLFEHLRELRYRLVVSILAIIVGMVVAWFFRYDLLDILQRPYFQAIEALKAKHPDANTSLVNINLTSPLTLSLKVSALAGAIVTAPFWLYQLWAFVVPGLLAKEKKWALIFIAAATPMFVGGVVVAYFVLPKAITVLLSFTQSGVTNLQDINAYLSFLLRLMIVFGIGFLIPLIVLMLNIVGVITAKQMAKYRTLVIFGTFVFGAVATPSTDPFSMLAVAAPMALLFVGAEVIAHILDRRKARRAALAGDDLLIRGSVDKDKALRELSQGSDDQLDSPG